MGKEILCPYCCKRFTANQVHFRLNTFIEEDNPEEQDDENELVRTVGRKKNFEKKIALSGEGKKLDEKLFKYYKDYYGDETSARQDAMQFDFVEFNPMNSGIQYNRQEMNEYGYVNHIIYKGQDLDVRLCPYCHNDLLKDAGKYDMYMISVIGDTNVGKSIYLTVLENVIEKGTFHASMFFVGTKEEKEYYRSTSVEVVQKRKMLKATIGRVPPLTFQLKYNNIETNQRNSILITFCDIAGEMCRDNDSLKIYGNHLRASSGLMFLVDPTRFARVRNMIEYGAELENLYQLEVISAINRFLISGTYEESSSIPTAIMITKSDTLKSLPFFQESEAKRMLIDDPDWNSRHPSYLNEDEICRISDGVQKFFEAMDEIDFTRKMGDLFTSYRFFINSALGHSPVNNEIEDAGEMIRRGTINPYRVTEAFYWLLAENNIIPRKLSRKYRNSKTNEEREVYVYYYKREDLIYINQKMEQKKQSAGIKDSLLGGKWIQVSEKHS